MSQATELIARQMAAGSANARVWADILYNVKLYGAKGDWNGTTGTDDTVSVQATIDAAIAAGGKAVFFPHGTYKVTALTNVSSVILFGDNAVFSGINNTITQIGAPVTSGIVYNVKDYGAKGDGTTIDTTKITDAITAATALGGIVFFPPGTYITGNQTVPYNVTLWFANGGKLSVNSGSTVTINGPIEAGASQIFSGAGLIRGNPLVEGLLAEWWGAKRDNVNDDTAAIQLAINFIDANAINTGAGGTLHLLPGIYKITDWIIIQCNNMTIKGHGMGVTIIKQYGVDKGVFDGTGNYLKKNCWIDGISFYADTYKAAECIKLLDSHNTHITKVEILKYQVGVSFLDRCFDCYLHDFVISDTSVNGDAIRVDVKPLGGGIFVYNGIIDCVNNLGTNGLHIISCSGGYFNDLDIRAANNAGILLNPIAGGVIIYNWFTNVLGDNGASACWIIDAPATAAIYGVFMDQCWGGSGGYGVVIRGAGDIDGIDMKGQVCIDNKSDGIYISAGKNITIQGGMFAGNSQLVSGQDCGIRVKPGVSNFRIIGSRSGQSIHRNNTQAFGIFVENGASNNYQIIDCDLTTNVSAGLVDQGTGTNKIIRSNLGAVTENGGTFTASGTGAVTVFNIPHGLVSAPTKYTVSAGSANASGSFFVTADATNIIVTYTTAPISGASNVVLRWDAKLYTLS